MAIKNIVVAFDESDGAHRALQIATDIAISDPDMSIDLAYVVPVPLLDNAQQMNFKEILDMMTAEGEEIVAEAVANMDPALEGRVSALILKGVNPATELIKLVEQGDYELRVIGSLGLGGIKEYMGSVSHKVLHGVNIPVLVAK